MLANRRKSNGDSPKPVVCTYYCGYGVDLLSLPVLGGSDADCAGGDTDSIDHEMPLSLEEQISRVERKIIEAALRRHNYRRSDTARELGISRVTLYNKMKKFGMLS
ncbi:MAG: hypothetical protein NUV77_13170 [Thermoguttaceae bacterium]|nr:hypothetical protein [Thermoguttaceae bacterium]